MNNKIQFVILIIFTLVVFNIGFAQEKKADLVIKDLKVIPDKPTVNKFFKINFVIVNEGNWSSVRPTVLFEVKNIKTLYVYCPVISQGKSYKASVPLKIDSEGTFEAKVYADCWNDTKESNENNNKKKIRFVVDDPSTEDESRDYILYVPNQQEDTPVVYFLKPQIQEEKYLLVTDSSNTPDLAITKFRILPGFLKNTKIRDKKIKQGKPADIVYEIKNIGTKETSGNKGIIKFDGRLPEKVINIPPLRPGTRYSGKIKQLFSKPGNYNIKLIVKQKDIEKSAKNNKSQKTITVQPKDMPDLKVVSITFSNDKPVAGAELSAYVKIKNSGMLRVDKTSKGKISVSGGVPDNNIQVVQLNPGAEVDYVYKFTPVNEGRHDVVVSLDTENKIKELDENNNKMSVALNIRPSVKPDLLIKKLKISPTEKYKGNDVTFVIVIANESDGPSPGFKLSFQTSAEKSTQVPSLINVFPHANQDPLKPWEKRTVKFKTSYSKTGQYNGLLSIDSSNLVNESNEKNNEKKFRFKITTPKRTDLEVVDFTASKSEISVGEEVIFTARIKNKSDIKSPPSGVSFQTGKDKTIVKIPSIIPFQQDTIRVFHKKTYRVAGNYTAVAIVDPAKKIKETNENNNRKEITIRVIENLPDLRVRLFRVNPNQIKADEQVELILFVKNRGEAKSEKCKAFFYWNPLGPPLEVDIAPLNPGERKKYVRKVTYNKAGSYKCKVVIDPTNEIKESRETNNESGVKTVTVVE